MRACFGLFLAFVAATAGAVADPVVKVKNGSYAGVYNQQYNQDFFLSIPFAQPPKRFSLAESLNTTWNGTRPSTAYSPYCVGYGGDSDGHVQSEDCLYLNIIRPAGLPSNVSLPVAVYIHGGGLYMGGGSDPRTNLSFTVQRSVELDTPVVGVRLQYRLAAYGFLGGALPQKQGVTNLGFRDQRLALHWIQENIAAFGGDPTKVTIWGESSGGQSVGAQLLAYGGRDDGLFRAAIAESGGPGQQGFVRAMLGLYNSTEFQEAYDWLVSNTSCASTIGQDTSLDCLRNLPFEELNTSLNQTNVVSALHPFAMTIDGDFVQTFPSIQLQNGQFVKVPFITGTNSEEGTAFGQGYGPNGTVNTDYDFRWSVSSTIPETAIANTGMSREEIIDYFSTLYSNIQAVGIPSLETYPHLITPNSSDATNYGLQFRRIAAYIGDITIIASRRMQASAWSNYSTPVYTYRFDVTAHGIPPIIGATHFQEVAFVFGNTLGVGYTSNPIANGSAAEAEAYTDLADEMNTAWVRFITTLDPNGPLGVHSTGSSIVSWPRFNTTEGGGVGKEIVWSVNGTGSYVEWDAYRANAIAFINKNALKIFGR